MSEKPVFDPAVMTIKGEEDAWVFDETLSVIKDETDGGWNADVVFKQVFFDHVTDTHVPKPWFGHFEQWYSCIIDENNEPHVCKKPELVFRDADGTELLRTTDNPSNLGWWFRFYKGEIADFFHGMADEIKSQIPVLDFIQTCIEPWGCMLTVREPRGESEYSDSPWAKEFTDFVKAHGGRVPNSPREVDDWYGDHPYTDWSEIPFHDLWSSCYFRFEMDMTIGGKVRKVRLSRNTMLCDEMNVEIRED